MAVDNDTKLTKFKSATTIVTADYANSIYGGLYGSSEADNLHPDDPRIIGHVHDGVKADGHASKIDLVDHVQNQLLNINLADDAVTKRNVRETLYQSEAIPEYEIIDGVTYYYLDLTGIRTDFTFIEDDAPSSADSGISENILIRQRSQTYDGTSYVDIPGVWGETTGRDFVFGSPSLEDINDGSNGDSRFLFDKSQSAFRAGLVSADQWDEASRGFASTAFGEDNIAAAYASFASGYLNDVQSTSSFAVCFGEGNTITDSSLSFIGNVQEGRIVGNPASTISSGYRNRIDVSSSPPSFLPFGFFGQHNLIVNGSENLIDISTFSTVLTGEQNSVEQSYSSMILSGSDNSISGAWTGAGKGSTTSTFNQIIGGSQNQVSDSVYSSVYSGESNQVSDSTYSSVYSGDSNSISSGISGIPTIFSAILSGANGSITGSAFSVIESGFESSIGNSADVYNTDEIPFYSSAFGGYAFAYAYGQRVQSSGTFDAGSAPLNSFPDAFPPPGTDWTLLAPEVGGSQTFTMTMFGNFQYDFGQIVTPPGIQTEQILVANLDNGQGIASPIRPFRPRINSSYSIKTSGTISFSEEDLAPPFGAPRTIRHSIAFTLRSGITVQEDGSILYNTDSFTVTHDSRNLYGSGAVRIKAPGTTNPNDDFRLWFTHDTASPTNRSPGIIGPPVLPPGFGFSFVLENRTFLNNGGPGTSSGSVFYGEALSVRMDVTEVNINLYRNI